MNIQEQKSAGQSGKSREPKRSSDTPARSAKNISENGMSKQERQSAGSAERPTGQSQGRRKERGTQTAKAGQIRDGLYAIAYRLRIEGARRQLSRRWEQESDALYELHENHETGTSQG